MSNQLIITLICGIVAALWGICLTLIAVVYTMHKTRLTELEIAHKDIGNRVLILEQQHKIEFAQFKKDLDELKQYVYDLVHKENNTLNQAQALIKAMYAKIGTTNENN